MTTVNHPSGDVHHFHQQAVVDLTVTPVESILPQLPPRSSVQLEQQQQSSTTDTMDTTPSPKPAQMSLSDLVTEKKKKMAMVRLREDSHDTSSSSSMTNRSDSNNNKEERDENEQTAIRKTREVTNTDCSSSSSTSSSDDDCDGAEYDDEYMASYTSAPPPAKRRRMYANDFYNHNRNTSTAKQQRKQKSPPSKKSKGGRPRGSKNKPKPQIPTPTPLAESTSTSGSSRFVSPIVIPASPVTTTTTATTSTTVTIPPAQTAPPLLSSSSPSTPPSVARPPVLQPPRTTVPTRTIPTNSPPVFRTVQQQNSASSTSTSTPPTRPMSLTEIIAIRASAKAKENAIANTISALLCPNPDSYKELYSLIEYGVTLEKNSFLSEFVNLQEREVQMKRASGLLVWDTVAKDERKLIFPPSATRPLLLSFVHGGFMYTVQSQLEMPFVAGMSQPTPPTDLVTRTPLGDPPHHHSSTFLNNNNSSGGGGAVTTKGNFEIVRTAGGTVVTRKNFEMIHTTQAHDYCKQLATVPFFGTRVRKDEAFFLSQPRLAKIPVNVLEANGIGADADRTQSRTRVVLSILDLKLMSWRYVAFFAPDLCTQFINVTLGPGDTLLALSSSGIVTQFTNGGAINNYSITPLKRIKVNLSSLSSPSTTTTPTTTPKSESSQRFIIFASDGSGGSGGSGGGDGIGGENDGNTSSSSSSSSPQERPKQKQRFGIISIEGIELFSFDEDAPTNTPPPVIRGKTIRLIKTKMKLSHFYDQTSYVGCGHHVFFLSPLNRTYQVLLRLNLVTGQYSKDYIHGKSPVVAIGLPPPTLSLVITTTTASSSVTPDDHTLYVHYTTPHFKTIASPSPSSSTASSSIPEWHYSRAILKLTLPECLFSSSSSSITTATTTTTRGFGSLVLPSVPKSKEALILSRLLTGSHHDISFVTPSGEIVNAHRAILSQYPYFDTFLNGRLSPTLSSSTSAPGVVKVNSEAEPFRALIQFIYGDFNPLAPEHKPYLKDLYELADLYMIYELKTILATHAIQQNDHVLLIGIYESLLLTDHKKGDHELMERVEEAFDLNSGVIVEMKEFEDFCATQPSSVTVALFRRFKKAAALNVKPNALIDTPIITNDLDF